MSGYLKERLAAGSGGGWQGLAGRGRGWLAGAGGSQELEGLPSPVKRALSGNVARATDALSERRPARTFICTFDGSCWHSGLLGGPAIVPLGPRWAASR